MDVCLVCRSICSCIPDNHPHRITSTKCRKNTVVSPYNGPIVARNMYRLIIILRTNCAPSLFYLKDYSVFTLHKILCASVSKTKLENAAYSTKFIERIRKAVKKKDPLNSLCFSASPIP